MAIPQIQIDQSGLSAGVAGASRDDLHPGVDIVCTDPANGLVDSQLWEVATPDGFTGSVAGTTGYTLTISGAARGDTFIIRRTVVISGTPYVSTAIQGGAAVKLLDGTRLPGLGETKQFSETKGWSKVMRDTILALTKGRLAAGNSIAEAVAANLSGTVTLLAGDHTLDADITDTTLTLKLMAGARVLVTANRTINCKVEVSDGGSFYPSNAIVLTFGPKAKILGLSPWTINVFDPRAGGVFHIPASAAGRLSPENFGASNSDYAFAINSVNIGTSTFTEPDHGLTTGQLVGFATTGTLPTGVSIATGVYAISVTSSTFKVASTYANALAGTAISLSGSSSGTHTLVQYDDVCCRAWRDAVQWDVTSAHGGPQPVLMPGAGYMLGGLLDARQIQWGGVNHHKEYRCLVFSQYNMKIQGAGVPLSAFHFRPLDQGGTYYDEYQLLIWELATEGQPITRCGMSGVFMRAGQSADVTKIAMYCHDVRNFRGYDLEVNNWTSTRRRCQWLRLAGRDANEFDCIKVNCDIPYTLDYNTLASVSLDANGIPDWQNLGNDACLADRKDNDHVSFSHCDLGTVDTAGDPNPWRACGWNKPGVVTRNWGQVTEGDCVGGIIVARDYLDGPDQDLGARSGNNFTVMGHGRHTADEVYFSTTGTAPTGLTAKTFYYLIVVDPDTLAFADSATKAVAGTKVTISSDGTGTHTISGTAFGGAAVKARRISENWRVCSNRIEGIANGHAGVFALDIQKDNNCPLLDLTLDDLNMAGTGDVRRATYTNNTASRTSQKLSGLRAEGVRRIGIGAGYRFGGQYKPLQVTPGTQLNFARDHRGRIVAAMLPQDNGFLYPESADQLAFIAQYYARAPMLAGQHCWALPSAQDGSMTGSGGIDLQAGGATTPTYFQFVDGYLRGWFGMTEATNQKLVMASAGADPTTTSCGLEGEFIADDAWTPGGTQRDVANLGGGNSGPLLRFNTDGTLFLRANATNGTASRFTYNNGIRTRFYLAVVHERSEILCYLQNANGRREIIRVTYSATLSNSPACYGGFDGSRRSIQGKVLPGEYRSGAAAAVNGWDLFDAKGDHPPSYYYDRMLHRRGEVSGLVPAYASASTFTIGTGSARDADNEGDVQLMRPVTVDLTVSGAGGLDTGSEVASKHYYAWAIADSSGVNAPAGLASLSATDPVMPSGYDLKFLAGAVYNDGGSNLLHFTTYGAGKKRQVVYDEDRANLGVLSGGSATAFTDVTLTFAPSIARRVELLADLDVGLAGGADNVAFVRPNGAASSDGPWQIGPGAILGASHYLRGARGWVGCDASQVSEYKVSDAADDLDLYLLAYEMEL